ncbi:MAG: hypothetical protein JXB60_06675, partial [Candidatus Cloacimonetes bacterium]|nr:hypothetical protein [Candidatus Cloacimonadota bacterium]
PNNSNVGLMTGNYFNKLTINKAATDIPLTAGSASDTLKNNYSMNTGNNHPRQEAFQETKTRQNNIAEIKERLAPVPGKDRDGNQVLITRDNTVLVTTDLVINSILEISNGIFDLNNHTVDANSRVDIHGILKMNTSNCILYAGSGTSHDIGWYSGSSANITAGTIYPSYSMTFFDGTNVLMGAGSLIYFSSDTYESGFWCYDADAQAGSVVFNKSSGNGYIAAGSTQPLRLSGDLDILNSNHFHLQSYDMFMEGTINITTGSLVDMGAVAEMEVDNDLILEGDLNIGAGTVIVHGIPTFSSSGSLNIAGGSFVCDTPDTGRNYIYINSDMDMTDGLFELTHNSIYFRINPKNVSGGTIRTGESFCANGAGIFQPSGGTVEITGSGNFASYLYSNNFFHDLLINRDPECGTGMYTDFTVKNDLAIQSGRLYNSSSYDLYLGGDWINNVGIDGFQEGTGTVIFTGPGESAIFSNETFYDLTVVDAIPGDFYTPEIQGGLNISVLHDLEIINGCIALLDNAVITVDGNINIHTGAGLNTTYGARVEFAGNWNDANTAVTGWQSYTAGNNSIFNAFGTSDQNISTSCPQLEVYQLLISKTGGNFIPAAAFKINGNLNFLSGYWIDSLTGLTHSLYGDFYTGSSAAWNSSDNTVRFTGPMEQSLEYYGSSGHLVNIIIDKAMPRQPENLLNSTGERDQDVIMYSDIPAQNGLISIQAGILNLNGNTLTQSGGNIVIGSSGTLIADAGAVIKLGAADELLVNAGGRLEVVGNATNPATVTRYGSGDYYTLEINALGTIAAKHAIFKYLGSNGITINDLAVVDPIYKFDFCSFSNGDPATGSCLLYFLDSADLEIQSASFPTINPGCYNVRKTLNAGDITFIDATGDFAGEDYENDPYGRIHWENSVLPAIENLTIIYNSLENCIELSWTYSAEYDSFRIYRGNYPDFIPEPGLLIGSTTSSNYTDYDLNPEKSFYRIIVVKN